MQCISKGKEHKKYEFGNKVSIIRSITGIILGAKSFRNEYDGHTIEESLLQVERITGKKVRRLAGDRGYRGKKEAGGTQILIPDVPNKRTVTTHEERNTSFFCKRAGIEPTIAHLKSDFRLGRNFYKGVFGDVINLLFSCRRIQLQKSHEDSFCRLLKISARYCFCEISRKYALLRDDYRA